uniref:Uncharacterized protein n=1 Tax=Arundo donax TaxID=35708 RepID=A0A0A9RHN8_ARUDO
MVGLRDARCAQQTDTNRILDKSTQRTKRISFWLLQQQSESESYS